MAYANDNIRGLHQRGTTNNSITNLESTASGITPAADKSTRPESFSNAINSSADATPGILAYETTIPLVNLATMIDHVFCCLSRNICRSSKLLKSFSLKQLCTSNSTPQSDMPSTYECTVFAGKCVSMLLSTAFAQYIVTHHEHQIGKNMVVIPTLALKLYLFMSLYKMSLRMSDYAAAMKHKADEANSIPRLVEQVTLNGLVDSLMGKLGSYAARGLLVLAAQDILFNIHNLSATVVFSVLAYFSFWYLALATSKHHSGRFWYLRKYDDEPIVALPNDSLETVFVQRLSDALVVVVENGTSELGIDYSNALLGPATFGATVTKLDHQVEALVRAKKEEAEQTVQHTSDLQKRNALALDAAQFFRDENHDLSEALATKEAELEDRAREIKELHRRMEHNAPLIKCLERQVQGQEGQITYLDHELAKARAETRDHMFRVEERENEIGRVTTKFHDLLAQGDNLARQLARCGEQDTMDRGLVKQKHMETLTAFRHELGLRTNKVDVLHEECDRLTDEMNKLKQDRARLDDTIFELDGKAFESQVTIQQLEAQLEAAAEDTYEIIKDQQREMNDLNCIVEEQNLQLDEDEVLGVDMAEKIDSLEDLLDTQKMINSQLMEEEAAHARRFQEAKKEWEDKVANHLELSRKQTERIDELHDEKQSLNARGDNLAHLLNVSIAEHQETTRCAIDLGCEVASKAAQIESLRAEAEKHRIESKKHVNALHTAHQFELTELHNKLYQQSRAETDALSKAMEIEKLQLARSTDSLRLEADRITDQYATELESHNATKKANAENNALGIAEIEACRAELKVLTEENEELSGIKEWDQVEDEEVDRRGSDAEHASLRCPLDEDISSDEGELLNTEDIDGSEGQWSD